MHIRIKESQTQPKKLFSEYQRNAENHKRAPKNLLSTSKIVQMIKINQHYTFIPIWLICV